METELLLEILVELRTMNRYLDMILLTAGLESEEIETRVMVNRVSEEIAKDYKKARVDPSNARWTYP